MSQPIPQPEQVSVQNQPKTNRGEMKLPLSPNGGSLVYIFWPTLYKVCICHTGKAVYLKKWPLCYTVSNLVATSACNKDHVSRKKYVKR